MSWASASASVLGRGNGPSAAIALPRMELGRSQSRRASFASPGVTNGAHSTSSKRSGRGGKTGGLTVL